MKARYFLNTFAALILFSASAPSEATTPEPRPQALGKELTNGCHIRRYRYQTDATFKMFASTVLCNFGKSANLNATIDLMPDLELARLTSLFERTNKQDMTPLTAIVAQKLDAKHLLRMKAAIGAPDLDKAVAKYSPAAVQGAYFAAPSPKLLPESHASFQSMGISSAKGLAAVVVAHPTLDMTIYEIYLDFLTSGLSVPASLAMTTGYTIAAVGGAWTAGYYVGGKIYNFVDWVAPDVTITIGDIEGVFVEGVTGAGGTYEGGQGGLKKR